MLLHNTKYCKALSPDQNTEVMKIDAAAHKKQQKSLSREQKGEVMTINAAAHKKQSMMLPPEKKARLMETSAEQCHEHMTEEDRKISAQIRSVAATLYKRVDLDKPTVEFLCEHFYKDPTLALAYFYCCSTDPCMAISIPIEQENLYKINFPATIKKMTQPHNCIVH